MKDSLPEGRSKGDLGHAITKAAISTLPIVGGPSAELFNFLIRAPAPKRIDEWLRSLHERLQAMEDKIPGLIESLPTKDEFVTAALHATGVATRTHQEEKLEALRNAVLNVAVGTASSTDRQLMFLTWVDIFTIVHLAFLQICSPSAAAGDRASVRTQLSRDNVFTDAVVHDLNSRGLLIDPRPYTARNRDPNQPLVDLQWQLSPLAQEFLTFIRQPAS